MKYTCSLIQMAAANQSMLQFSLAAPHIGTMNLTLPKEIADKFKTHQAYTLQEIDALVTGQ
jgi:hypothetical protein